MESSKGNIASLMAVGTAPCGALCGVPSTLCPEISHQSPAPATLCARPASFFARPVTLCGSPFTLSPSQRLYRRFSDPVSRFRESLRLKTGRTRGGSSKFKAESRRDGISVATAERESPQLRRSGIGPHMPPLRGLVDSSGAFLQLFRSYGAAASSRLNFEL